MVDPALGVLEYAMKRKDKDLRGALQAAREVLDRGGWTCRIPLSRNLFGERERASGLGQGADKRATHTGEHAAKTAYRPADGT